MAILGLTRLEKKDFLTAAIWNSVMDILEAKFAGGVSQSDLTWPLLAQGNIDMQGLYTITNMRTFWNVVNAEEYSSLDAAVSAVEALGGGAVFIPPYSTSPITANNVSIDASNVTIFGCGVKSVIKITAASTNPLLTTSGAGISDFRLLNLMLDGTGGGAGCVGLLAKRVTRLVVDKVYTTGFTGKHISLTNSGVAGQSCVDAFLNGVHSSGGSDVHLHADDISGLIVLGYVSKGAASDAIRMVPAGATNLIQDVLIDGARIHTPGGKGVSIVGSGAAGIDAQSRVTVANTHVVSATGIPIELGTTAALLKDAHARGNFAPGSLTDGVRMASNRGSILACSVPAATGDGIDITNSVDVWVQGNNCQGATLYGVNAGTTTTCVVTGNNCTGSGSADGGVNHTGSTGLIARDNIGDVGPTAGTVFANFTAETIAGAGTGAFAFTHTIRANSFKTGDVAEIIAIIETGAGSTGSLQIKIGATVLKTLAFVASTTYFMRCLVKANTAGNCDTAFVFVTEAAATNQDIDYGSPAVTWTTDQAVTFNVSAHGGAGNITLARAAVFYHGSK